jgi:hypothetical protein
MIWDIRKAERWRRGVRMSMISFCELTSGYAPRDWSV